MTKVTWFQTYAKSTVKKRGIIDTRGLTQVVQVMVQSYGPVEKLHMCKDHVDIVLRVGVMVKP